MITHPSILRTNQLVQKLLGGTKKITNTMIPIINEAVKSDIKIIEVENVHGYVDENGTVWINVADVARGLGFVEVKNNVEYIRWRTINGYLKAFGFSQDTAKDAFIPENMFYRLAMKASNETAQKFQAKIADEILPTIRKTGMYSVKPLSATQMFLQAAIAMAEQEKQIQEHETILRQHDRDIKALKENSNGITLRHEMVDIKQQQQLDKHETDISNLQEKVEDILAIPDDVSKEIKHCVTILTNGFKPYCSLPPADGRLKATEDLFSAISEAAGHSPSYISDLRKEQRKRLTDQGKLKDSTIKQKVTGVTIINADSRLRSATISVVTTVNKNWKKVQDKRAEREEN